MKKHLVKYHKQETNDRQHFECTSCSKTFLTEFSLDKHEIACRLKKQEILNRELDGEASFLDVSVKHEMVTSDSSIILQSIKQEPEEYVEQLQVFSNAQIKEEPVDLDPFDLSMIIKQENEVLTVSDDEPEPYVKQEPECSFVLDDWLDSDGAVTETVAIKEEPMEVGPVKLMTIVTKIRCKLCDTRFDDKQEFVQHFKNVHRKQTADCQSSRMKRILKPVATVKKFKCKTCDELFDTVDDVKKHNFVMHVFHLPTEEIKLLNYGQASLLKMHYIKSHHTVKSYKSTQQEILQKKQANAELNFPRKPSVIQNPVWVVKFKCKTCLQVFKTPDDLQKHFTLRHAAINEAPDDGRLRYYCSNCPKVFDRGYLLQEHFHVDHRGEKRDEYRTNKRMKQEEDSELLVQGIPSVKSKRDASNSTEDQAGEPDNIDEMTLERMFNGKTLNKFTKLFECQICSTNGFEKLHDLKQHCVIDHRIKKFKCLRCSLSFEEKCLMRMHWRLTHSYSRFAGCYHQRDFAIPNKAVKCPQCDRILSHRQSLIRHIRLVHMKRKTLYCDQCAETFIDYRTLQNHVTKSHSKIDEDEIKPIIRRRKTTQAIKCEECGEVAFGKVGIQTHRWNKHFNIRIVDKQRFHCLICLQIMNCRASAIRHHRQVHDSGKVRQRTCQECDMQFQLFEDFKEHIDQDHKDAHICLICGCSLTSSSDLIQHNKAHRAVPDNEKNRICDMCGFKAQQKLTIEAHMVKMHGAKKKEYSATCEICGAFFSCYQSFHAHRKTHQERLSSKFKCSFCGKEFSNIRDLSDHESGHKNPDSKLFEIHCSTAKAFRIVLFTQRNLINVNSKDATKTTRVLAVTLGMSSKFKPSVPQFNCPNETSDLSADIHTTAIATNANHVLKSSHRVKK